jgi:hypothetical protein
VSIIALAIRVVLVGCFVGFLAVPSRSEDAKPSGSAANPPATPAAPATPVDDFGQEYKKFKEQLTDLPKKIEETSRLVEGRTTAASTHAQIDALRAIVSTALAQVVDNGPVAKLGQTALNFTRQKLTDLQQDTHYTKEQREYLIKQWTATSRLTAGAVDELEVARKELTGLLKVLQSNDDYIGELEALNNAAKTVEVIRDLTSGLREISAHLKVLLQRMNSPSM